MALFVFFAGATWARIVSANLLPGPALTGLASVTAAGARSCLQFALLLAVEFLFKLVDCG
jgi:hypothetical protein